MLGAPFRPCVLIGLLKPHDRVWATTPAPVGGRTTQYTVDRQQTLDQGSRIVGVVRLSPTRLHHFVGLDTAVVERAEPLVDREQQAPIVHLEIPVVEVVEVVAALYVSPEQVEPVEAGV